MHRQSDTTIRPKTLNKRSVKHMAVAVCAIVALVGCNTVQGLGQDIESVGRKGEEVIKGE